MASDPYKYFRPEARDLLDQCAKGVLELEKRGTSTATVQRLLRLAHTLKGAARVVKQSGIADRAHAIEDALSPFRDGDAIIARAQIDTILAHLDEIGGQIVTLAPADDAGRPGPGKPSQDDVARTVRTDIAETDAVLDGIAETHALLNGLRTTAQRMEQARHLADLLLAQLAPHGAADHERSSGRGPQHLHAIGEELRRSLGGAERNLGSTVDQMDRELQQLRDAAERLRLAPVDSLFVALERTARDIAQTLGKQVTFEGKGGNIRLDAHVLETMRDALIQIVRNAVAHGIEADRERTADGKPQSGRITVGVSRRGRRIVFECRDDGRGLDLDAVRRAAVQRGLIEPAAQQLGADELTRMLLGGGISTSTTVTGVSGRGVGLDVVRDAMARLHGEVTVRSEPGIGTTFELAIPPSLASMEALIVDAGGSPVAIPLDAVRRTLRVDARDISRAAVGASIPYERQAIAFIPLSSALDGTRWPADRNWTAVVVAGAGGLAAIGVDRMLGTARIVVRPLPDGLAASPIVAGALLDPESNPQLILDPDGLVAVARRGDAGGLEPPPQRRPVLVVDDSLTTRMLEQSILESAGYEVDAVVSAEAALDAVRRKPYALILVDVEMPGMDGFTFVERIRSDPILRGIPAILVTSLAAPEDRQRGRDAGAQGYIVKSEFDQAELLAMIKPLME
jgi:two-component system chemotaxis sensor kinase CheA